MLSRGLAAIVRLGGLALPPQPSCLPNLSCQFVQNAEPGTLAKSCIIQPTIYSFSCDWPVVRGIPGWLLALKFTFLPRLRPYPMRRHRLLWFRLTCCCGFSIHAFPASLIVSLSEQVLKQLHAF